MHFIIDNDLLKKSKALNIYSKMIFIASLVLLLIIKLRFPKGKSIHRVIQEYYSFINIIVTSMLNSYIKGALQKR